MEKTTTELTQEYIKNHPTIKSCLKKKLINYSALARLISKDLKIENKTSKEAILIASRRFQEKLKKESSYEKEISKLLENSELEIKNKIIVHILNKSLSFDNIEQVQKTIKSDYGIFYLIEGSKNYTLISQEKYAELIEKKFSRDIVKKDKNLALITIKSSKEIETTIGVVSYLTSLFTENGVNIKEFFSCWTDTLFIVDSNDVNKTISFLKF